MSEKPSRWVGDGKSNSFGGVADAKWGARCAIGTFSWALAMMRRGKKVRQADVNHLAYALTPTTKPDHITVYCTAFPPSVTEVWTMPVMCLLATNWEAAE